MTIATGIEYRVELPFQLVAMIEEMKANTGGRIIVVDDSSRISLAEDNENMVVTELWYSASDVAEAIALVAPDSIVSTPRSIRSFVLAFCTADVIVATYDGSIDLGRLIVEVLPDAA